MEKPAATLEKDVCERYISEEFPKVGEQNSARAHFLNQVHSYIQQTIVESLNDQDFFELICDT